MFFANLDVFAFISANTNKTSTVSILIYIFLDQNTSNLYTGHLSMVMKIIRTKNKMSIRPYFHIQSCNTIHIILVTHLLLCFTITLYTDKLHIFDCVIHVPELFKFLNV